MWSILCCIFCSIPVYDQTLAKIFLKWRRKYKKQLQAIVSKRVIGVSLFLSTQSRYQNLSSILLKKRREEILIPNRFSLQIRMLAQHKITWCKANRVDELFWWYFSALKMSWSIGQEKCNHWNIKNMLNFATLKHWKFYKFTYEFPTKMQNGGLNLVLSE
jgi:hypothetical protein